MVLPTSAISHKQVKRNYYEKDHFSLRGISHAEWHTRR